MEFLCISVGFFAAAAGASAFQTSLPGHHAARPQVQCGMSSVIDLRPSSTGRDVYAMEEWARGYGVQTAPGVELVTEDRQDYGVRASQGISAGSPVMFVPASLVLSSSAIQQEFAGGLDGAEQILTQVGAADRLPLFRLMVKILREYELGMESPYYAWLNSMPKLFYNGVAMSDACFEALPPYVARLAFNERQNFAYDFDALSRGGVPLSPETTRNEDIAKWAYNIALTRHQVVIPAVEKKISPLADMLNHGTYPNVEITYDDQGNCMVTAMYDIPAGSPLTVSLGDPSNPSPMFATYGFLEDDTPGIFCKALEHEGEMQELGYGFKDMLFGTQTGEISAQVWDVFLYKLLKDNNDENQTNFLTAVRNNDEGTKQQVAQQYFPYTLQALKDHVDGTIGLINQLIMKANTYDRTTHPRVVIIIAHNELVKETFEKVQSQLYAMG